MRRKILCAALLAVVWGVLCMPVYANSGSIRVQLDGEGEVTLYRVGVLQRENFRLSDEHGGGEVTFDDVLRPELALWLASRAKGGISRETEEGIVVFSGLSEGLYLAVQTENCSGNEAFEPFLVMLPWDGDTWNLEVQPQILSVSEDLPKTGDKGFVVLSSWIMCASMIGLLVIGSRKKY